MVFQGSEPKVTGNGASAKCCCTYNLGPSSLELDCLTHLLVHFSNQRCPGSVDLRPDQHRLLGSLQAPRGGPQLDSPRLQRSDRLQLDHRLLGQVIDDGRAQRYPLPGDETNPEPLICCSLVERNNTFFSKTVIWRPL